MIESGETFRGKLKETVIYSEPINLKDKYQLDYIVDLSNEELDELFGYSEPPILIEPNKSELELRNVIILHIVNFFSEKVVGLQKNGIPIFYQ